MEAHPWGRLSLLLSVPCSSLSRVEACWAFPICQHTYRCCTWLGLVQAVIMLRFCGYSSPVVSRRQSHSRFSGPLTLIIFLPLLTFFHSVHLALDARVVLHICPLRYILTRHGFLYWSVYCKKRLPWWEVRTTLTCGYKGRYLE